MSVILLTTAAMAATVVLARFKPEMWVAQAFVVLPSRRSRTSRIPVLEYRVCRYLASLG